MLTKLLILSVLSVSIAEKVRYDNYTLYKVHPQNEDGLVYLNDLYEHMDGLDFWIPPTRVGQYASVVASPQVKGQFEENLQQNSVYAQVMLDNIQEALDAQVYSRKRRDASRQLYWTSYVTLDDVTEWFEYLAETYPGVVTIVSAGQSYEGRNIPGVKISRGSSRRAFFLEGGQVGADWLSPTVVTYIVDQLVRGEDPEARAASEEFDWYIFPVANPDGHEFTQVSTRLWLKNLRPITADATGVDLTRNWNSLWGVSGGSFTPADSNFIGIGPFSEIETRSLSRYIETIPNLVGSLSFRAFGQRLVIPFAHTTLPWYNYNEMITIGRRAMGSLAVRYGTQFIVGTSAEVLDGATGNLADWVKYRFNPPIVATYHLRDAGTWGYTLPVEQVLPSCEETYDSVMAIIREAKFINVL